MPELDKTVAFIQAEHWSYGNVNLQLSDFLVVAFAIPLGG